jgi:hypothetical protein
MYNGESEHSTLRVVVVISLGVSQRAATFAQALIIRGPVVAFILILTLD